MKRHPTLVIGAETHYALGEPTEVLMAIQLTPQFQSRATSLERLCNRHRLRDIETDSIGITVWLDTAPGTPLASAKDIAWTWSASEYTHFWTVYGHMEMGPDDYYLALVQTPIFASSQLRQLFSRPDRRSMYVGSRDERLPGYQDRSAPGWRRLVELNFSLPEPFGRLDLEPI